MVTHCSRSSENLYRMQIHLAETSNERGQYQSRIDTEKTEHLVSYAYKDSHDFDIAWDEQTKEMQIYLAGGKSTENKKVILTQSSHDSLLSYEDKRKVEIKMDLFLAGHTANKDTEKTRQSHRNHLSTFADQKEVSTKVETIVDKKTPQNIN